MVAVLFGLIITILVLVDWSVQLLQASRTRRAALRSPSQVASLDPQDAVTPPPGLFFHRSHTWAFLQPNGSIRVGLDGLVGFLLGRLDQVRLPEAGTQVLEGEPFAWLVQGERELGLPAPFDGTVVQVNRELIPDGLFISSEPYGAGWICEIRPDSLSHALSKLVVADRATAWHTRECEKISSFFMSKGLGDIGLDTVGPTGATSGGVLRGVGDDVWRAFRAKFIDAKRGKPA